MIAQSKHRLDLLAGLTRTQAERLSHIDFRLYFLGELRRLDVSERFGTGPAGATRDIAMYREIAPLNLVLDPSDKIYRPSEVFQPVFDHVPERVLTALSQGFGEGFGTANGPLVRCEFPLSLNIPAMAILAPVTRAIHRGKAVRLRYRSTSSGASQREIVPIALVDAGVRWHVHAYDRKSQEFRDFVFTRMSDVFLLEDGTLAVGESVDHDVQWNRIIELELVPHPDYPDPAIVRMDYDMRDGVLGVRVRAANVGYMLRRWNVDCSTDHSLGGPACALWLRDPLALYGASNAILAPGYSDPRGTKNAATNRL
ncbi:MAG: WYL domain-containing protein [Burkholderiaceae bacterium]